MSMRSLQEPVFFVYEQAQREGGILEDVDGFGWWILTPALGVLERLWLAVVPLPQTPQASPGTVI